MAKQDNDKPQQDRSYKVTNTYGLCACVMLYLVEKKQVIFDRINFFQSFSEVPGLRWRNVEDEDSSLSIIS